MLDPRAPGLELVGPFERHEVVVNGWQVPLLQARPEPGGRIVVTLDNRIALDLTVDESERFLPFLADAIAVAQGFTCHPREGQIEPLRATTLGPRPLRALDTAESD
jgi:hypothetical protein